ncbi:MAG TPA: type I-C CRISPR-associated protein Cas7/Csd2 [Firmicutes bacterium]|nr:type I-C CRISPR-associated protein Cas7/Csd2 [Candidatus Fermentithermobacillaceae bacterium]
MKNPIDKRYEFVLLFDVENGNPNGDPDAGNMPRIDAETNLGLVTDVCLKRKVRNYVALVKDGQPGYDIYVREGVILNSQNKKAYDAYGIDPDNKAAAKAKAKELTKFMCDNFYDIRTFGAVMTTDVNCGQVRGPVQLGFARSVDPIVPQEVSITRLAVTNERDAEKERTMGRKHIVPYALYRAEGYVSAALAKQTGFSADDLELFWEALENMFEHDRSAARGKMATRKLIVFEHSTALGNVHAHTLFDCVKVRRVDMSRPPRAFSDYIVEIDRKAIPDSVRVIERM